MKQALLHDVWLVLADAVKQRTPFTLMQLATVGEDGAPKIRTIVLRSFNEASTSLSFITDLRSPKVREITANPCVSLAGFDNERVVQLRIDGRAEIIEDETRRRDFWNALRIHISSFGRHCRRGQCWPRRMKWKPTIAIRRPPMRGSAWSRSS